MKSRILQCIDAIDHEIAAAKQVASGSIRVRDGLRCYSAGGTHVYSFNTNSQMPLQSDTPLTFEKSDGTGIKGSLFETRPYQVLIQLDENLGDRIANGQVYAEPWFILQKLQRRLHDSIDDPDTNWELLRGALACRQPRTIPVDFEDKPGLSGVDTRADDTPLNPGQRHAIREALSHDLHFVWGPTGTGKTHTLAHLAARFIEVDERLLVCTHSNVALDRAMVAIARAVDDHEALENARILRVGPPFLQEAIETPLIQAKEHIK